MLVTNTFALNGSYTVELMVTDMLGSNATDTVDIVVDLPANIVLTTSVESDSAVLPTVSSNDLAQTQYLSSSASGGWAVSTKHVGLFTGSITNEVWLSTDASVMVNFDISANTAGYDISGISTLFGWNTGAGGRANQGYRVVVTYVDDTAEILISDELWEATGGYWTTVTFEGTNGVAIATGVKAVTFDKIYPANAADHGDYTVAREFDVFGVPSPIPPDKGTILIIL